MMANLKQSKVALRAFGQLRGQLETLLDGIHCERARASCRPQPSPKQRKAVWQKYLQLNCQGMVPAINNERSSTMSKQSERYKKYGLGFGKILFDFQITSSIAPTILKLLKNL